MKVKITFDKEKLPKLSILIRRWMQLDIVQENKSSITVEGAEHVIDVMLRDAYFHVKRHNALDRYKVEYVKPIVQVEM